MRTLTTFPALSSVCVTVMAELYFSGTKDMLSSLYKELNTCHVRSIQGSEYSLKVKFKARLTIKDVEVCNETLVKNLSWRDAQEIVKSDFTEGVRVSRQ